MILRANTGGHNFPLSPHLRLIVLEPMGFIHDEAGPVDRAQDSHVNGDQLIGCQQHMELHRCLFLHKTATWSLMFNFSSISKPKGLMGLFPPSSCHRFASPQGPSHKEAN